MKSLIELLQEAEEDNEKMEVEVDTEEANIRNPSYVFEINGRFDFNELERLLRNNEAGLTLDGYELKIDTKGLVDDAAYENFIQEVEKLKYLKFLR